MMPWLRVIAGGLGTLLVVAIIAGLYLGISTLVLWMTGRVLPLAGRGRRKR